MKSRSLWPVLSVYQSTGLNPCQYLVHIVVVDDAVKALVDVVEHVYNLHRCAVLAQSGEADYVTEIYCHLIVQLWLHHTSLLQAFHHRATRRETCTKKDRTMTQGDSPLRSF